MFPKNAKTRNLPGLCIYYTPITTAFVVKSYTIPSSFHLKT